MGNRNLPLFLAFLLTLTLGAFAPDAAAARPLQAGGSAKPITPADLNYIWIAGFGTGRAAQGVHDDLWARAFVVDDGVEEIVICVVDLIGYMTWRIDGIKDELVNRGFQRKNIIIASTHNHESPDAMGLWGPTFGQSGVKSSYLDYVDQQVIAAVEEARATKRRAGLRFGLTQAGDIAWDFRDPQVFDRDIHGMQAVDLDGNVIFTACHYGNHPEVLWNRNVYLTADYPGFLCQRLETTYDAPAIYMNGHLGGLISPKVPDVFGDDNYSFTFARRYGHNLADETSTALAGQPVHYDLNLTTQMTRVNIPIDNPLFLLGARVGTFEVPLQWLLDRNMTIPADLHVFQFGDVATISNVPGEMFPEVGIEIDDALPGQYKMTINLGNTQLGYMIPPIDFNFPDDPFNAGDNYEETVSAGIQTVPIVQSAIFSMIGHPTPTPFNTPTPSPTITPTPVATNTPTPPPPTATPTATPSTQAPEVYMAGFADTNLDSGGGSVNLLSVVQPGSAPLAEIEVYLEGVPTGLQLTEVFQDVYGFLDVPIGALPPGSITVEVRAKDANNLQGGSWPYLNVAP